MIGQPSTPENPITQEQMNDAILIRHIRGALDVHTDVEVLRTFVAVEMTSMIQYMNEKKVLTGYNEEKEDRMVKLTDSLVKAGLIAPISEENTTVH